MSKYYFVVMLVLGALIISTIQFLLYDAVKAFTNLTIFLAAGGRLIPATLRIQQAALSIKSNLTFNTPISNLKSLEAESPKSFSDFSGNVLLKNIEFKHPNSNEFLLSGIDL